MFNLIPRWRHVLVGVALDPVEFVVDFSDTVFELLDARYERREGVVRRLVQLNCVAQSHQTCFLPLLLLNERAFALLAVTSVVKHCSR